MVSIDDAVTTVTTTEQPGSNMQTLTAKTKEQMVEDLSESSTLTCLSETSSASKNNGSAFMLPSPPPPPLSTPLHEVVRLKASRRTATLAEKPHDIEVHIQDYHPISSLQKGASATPSVQVHAVSASMSWKGEDRHCIQLLEPTMTTGQSKAAGATTATSLMAFCGVFDGHDGPDAAEYCAQGLLPHVLYETREAVESGGKLDDNGGTHKSPGRRPQPWRRLSQRFSRSRRGGLLDGGDTEDDPLSGDTNASIPKSSLGRSTPTIPWWRDRLSPGYVRAFEAAQDQFVLHGAPPGVEAPSLTGVVPPLLEQAPPVKDTAIATDGSKSPRFRKLAANLLRNKNPGPENKTVRPGGTTACTLSIYMGQDETSPPFAVVANCGDSRLFVDSGLPSPLQAFHQVTRDHRVINDAEDSEVMRLTAAKAIVRNQRIYPGGLAVSRTIGDAAFASAVIATPDVFVLDLAPVSEPSSLAANATHDPADSTVDQRQDDDSHGSSLAASNSSMTGHTITHRFILATDGLWDSLHFLKHGNHKSKSPRATHTVQRTVDELANQEHARHPKTAAMNLMKSCLNKVGCFDDITVLVVDVTVCSN